MNAPSIAQGRIQLAIDRLNSDYPLHAGILAQWRVESSSEIGTMGVGFRDGRLCLVYSPEFVESIGMDELMGVLHHEVNHVLFGHVCHEPDKHEDGEALTIAEEVTVNEWVPEPLPGTPVLLEQYPFLPENESTEERYEKLQKRSKMSLGAPRGANSRQIQPGSSPQSSNSAGAGSGQSGGTGQAGQQAQSGAGGAASQRAGNHPGGKPRQSSPGGSGGDPLNIVGSSSPKSGGNRSQHGNAGQPGVGGQRGSATQPSGTGSAGKGASGKAGQIGQPCGASQSSGTGQPGGTAPGSGNHPGGTGQPGGTSRSGKSGKGGNAGNGTGAGSQPGGNPRQASQPATDGVPTTDDHSMWAEARDSKEQAERSAKMDIAVAWGSLTPQERDKVTEPFAEIAEAAAEESGFESDSSCEAGDEAGEEVEALHGGQGHVPWQVVLRRHVGRILERRPVFGRLPRRFPDMAGIIPGKGRFAQKPKVMAAIDTSGSLTGATLAAISAELGLMSKHFDVVVVECDTRIYRVYPYRPIESVMGRGGTDLRPPLAPDFLKTHQPDLVVYFTDGYGPAPEKPPAVPVVWAITEDGEKPVPWGLEVALSVPEIGPLVPEIGPGTGIFGESTKGIGAAGSQDR